MNIEEIKRLIRIVEPIIKSSDQKQLSFPSQTMFNHFLNRIFNNLNTIEILLRNDQLIINQGLSLIIRNMLSDFITCAYIICRSIDFKDSDNLFYALLYTDIKKSKSYVKFAKTKISTKKDIDLEADENVKHIVDYFNSNNLKLFPSFRGIVEELMYEDLELPTNWKSDIFQAYDLWILLSKNEHAGWYSFSLRNTINEDEMIGRSKEVIKIISFLVGNLCEYLDQDFDPKELMELYNEL